MQQTVARGVAASFVAVLLAALSACGASSGVSAPASSASPSATPVSGDFSGQIDIGGGPFRYLACRGSGSPTVILESGYHDSSDLWSSSEVSPPVVGKRSSRPVAVDHYEITST